MSRRKKTDVELAGRAPRITPGKAKNLIGVARVVGPVVLPVVTPYLLKAVSAARGGMERYRARKLGVPVGDLAEYSGRGGALHARIVGADAALTDLAAHASGAHAEQDRAFAETGHTTLAKLAAAIRAAERMPATRRRAAHKAVSAELDQLEAELLRRIGV